MVVTWTAQHQAVIDMAKYSRLVGSFQPTQKFECQWHEHGVEWQMAVVYDSFGQCLHGQTGLGRE